MQDIELLRKELLEDIYYLSINKHIPIQIMNYTQLMYLRDLLKNKIYLKKQIIKSELQYLIESQQIEYPYDIETLPLSTLVKHLTDFKLKNASLKLSTFRRNQQTQIQTPKPKL